MGRKDKLPCWGAGGPSARGVCTAAVANMGRKEVSPAVMSAVRRGHLRQMWPASSPWLGMDRDL